MSKLRNKSQGTGTLADALNQLGAAVKNGGTNFVDSEDTKNLLSLESLDDTQFENFRSRHDSVIATLKQAYATAQVSTEGFTPQQWEAGAIAAAAAGNFTDYAKAGYFGQAKGGDNVTIVGAPTNSAFDYRDSPAYGMEAFDERELKATLPFSIMFNVQAARQNEFGEAFYPTVVITPDQAGLDVTVTQTMIVDPTYHDVTGQAYDLNRRNLIEAIIDPTILANTATQVVPYFVTGNTANNKMFTADVAPTMVTANGATFLSAPYKPGVKIDLLGISQNPGLAAEGQLDQTDSLDQRMNLENIYLKVVGTSVGGAGSIIPFNTRTLPFSQFQKSPEGYSRDVLLNYSTVDLPLTAATHDISGAPAAALALLSQPQYAGYVLRLALAVNGTANFELGNATVFGTGATIASVYQVSAVDGSVVHVTDSTILAALQAEYAAITLSGYDLYAFRSNINRRQRGLMVETVIQTERYVIPLSGPITAPMPVTDTRTAVDLLAPLNAARTRNSNNAVTQIIAYAAQLNALNLSASSLQSAPAVEGIGRLVVRPYFELAQLDMVEATNSLASHRKVEDVAAAFINQIRDMVYRAYRDSGYQPALDAATGGTDERPQLIIGTDPVIIRHLLVPGDTRTASIGFDFQIVSTYDKRVKNQIFMAFTRKGVQGADALSFGVMGWIPELATTLQVTRNNSTVKELMVQPRTRHINTCPILMQINVSNLDAVVTERVAQEVNIT
jgi:hypothetical protein